MHPTPCTVSVFSEYGVYSGNERGVSGVAVEAGTTKQTMDVLKGVIFDLMESNGIWAKHDMDIVVRFAKREESLSMKAA